MGRLTLVVREVVLHRAHRELLLEAINLVEEQDDGSLDEPSGVADGVEKGESLLHTVDGFVFEKKLVVLGDSNKEEDGRDVLEAVDPLLTLRTLTADVEHAVGKVTNDERSFGNTSGLDTRAKDILIVWQVVRLSDAANGIEIAENTVVSFALTVLLLRVHEEEEVAAKARILNGLDDWLLRCRHDG